MLTFDLATLQKPQRLARVAQKAEQLAKVMEAAGKPMAAIQARMDRNVKLQAVA